MQKGRLCKFKKGDKVRMKGAHKTVDVVIGVPGILTYDLERFLSGDEGMVLADAGWDFQKYWEHIPSNKKMAAAKHSMPKGFNKKRARSK